MPTTPRQPAWQELLEQAREEIESIRTPSGARPAAATRALQQLSELGAAVERRLEAEADARRRRVVGPRGPERTVIYQIEASPRGDALTERREGGPARPMKTPIAIYRATATVVASLKTPERFGPIHRAVEQHLRETIPPYAPRVAIRCWIALGLIEHTQARFRPALPPQRFLAETRRAWRQLAEQPLRVDPSG